MPTRDILRTNYVNNEEANFKRSMIFAYHLTHGPVAKYKPSFQVQAHYKQNVSRPFYLYNGICYIYWYNGVYIVKRPQVHFSCDQAALWMVFSVRLSVCLSVRLSVTPFWLCSHHRIIMKFSGVITTDQGNVHAKGQGQRSKVKVTEVTIQIFVSGL